MADAEPAFKLLEQRFGRETLGRIERIGLAVVPQPENKVGYGIVAEGTFDEPAMRRALGSGEVLTLQPASEGRPDFSVAVIRGGHLVLGPQRVLDAVRAAEGQPGTGLDSNTTILRQLEKVRPTSQLWGAVDFRTMARQGRQAAAVQGLGQALQENPAASALIAFAFQGRIGATVEFDLLGQAEGEASARKLADAARGLVAVGRMGAASGQAADWQAFLDAITVDQEGAEIHLHGTLPDRVLAALAEKARAAAASIPSPAGPAAAPVPTPAIRSPARAPNRPGG